MKHEIESHGDPFETSEVNSIRQDSKKLLSKAYQKINAVNRVTGLKLDDTKDITQLFLIAATWLALLFVIFFTEKSIQQSYNWTRILPFPLKAAEWMNEWATVKQSNCSLKKNNNSNIWHVGRRSNSLFCEVICAQHDMQFQSNRRESQKITWIADYHTNLAHFLIENENIIFSAIYLISMS